MKKLVFSIVTLFILFACNNDDNDQPREPLLIGKWNLTKIENTSSGGSMSPNKNKTHFYQIEQGGTFKRIMFENSTTNELKGTYIVTDENSIYGNENNSIKKFIELSYSSPDVKFFNCGFDEKKQLLILTSDNKLINNLSGACDGDNYEYKKEK